MNSILRNALAASTMAIATQAAAQATFYEHPNFQGQSFTTEQTIGNLERYGFNNRASSARVRGDAWQVCDGAGFSGQCVDAAAGRLHVAGRDGLERQRFLGTSRQQGHARRDDRYAPYDSRNPLSSEHRYVPGDYRSASAPASAAYPDYRRRGGERLYEANVTSVRAVVGAPEQRCWVEREQISQDRRSVNVPGAIAGAVLGGIIGHQVGSGRHQDLATAGGAVAGGAIGANVGRSGGQTQDVQRCENVSSQARPDHWDVTYTFRGQEHRIQMTSPPGPTVTVNEQGEPGRTPDWRPSNMNHKSVGTQSCTTAATRRTLGPASTRSSFAARDCMASRSAARCPPGRGSPFPRERAFRHRSQHLSLVQLRHSRQAFQGDRDGARQG